MSVRLCTLAELKDGEALRVELDDIDVAVVKVHAEVPLSQGEVSGCTIECELHGSRFDLRTGKPTGPPATRPVPVFETSVIDGVVYAELENK
jgi:3-phenylpropionate/trans-cinnamate dioxygenase ferredoxin subunit